MTDFETLTVNYTPENMFDKGTRSECYRQDDHIIKLVYGPKNQNEAVVLSQKLYDEYNTIKQFMGQYVVPTNFGVSGDGTGRYPVVMVQPFIEGTSLKEALTLSSEKGFNKDNIIDFLVKAKTMYESIKQIPDIFGRPHGIGWYDVLSTPNVKVEISQEKILNPKLCDIAFTRLSKKPIIGDVHNKLLVNNINSTLQVIGR